MATNADGDDADDDDDEADEADAKGECEKLSIAMMRL
jgi:hypothetical protein